MMALSVICLVGCSKNKGQSTGESAPPQESVYEELGDSLITVNQSEVSICVGDVFTLTATAENIPNANFNWLIDGDCDQDVLSLAQTDSVCKITALKVGETKVIVTVTSGNQTYFKSVKVTVSEASEVTIVLGDNVGFDNDGYFVKLSTTTDGGATQIVPIITAYKNNKIVSSSTVWESQDTAVVTVDGNKFTSAGAGVTQVVGNCTVEGKVYQVVIKVEVSKPTITLEESFTVEVENLKPLQIITEIKGKYPEVLYNGQSVGEYDIQTKILTLDKSLLPKESKLMGDNCQFYIQTSIANYLLNVNLYTKVISDKDEFIEMATLSKNACPQNPALWDGYFILDSDIEINGIFESKIADLDSLWGAVEGMWSNGGLYGFKGVFDGKGYKIEGVQIEKGKQIASVFGVLHIDGVIKNVSFTKAKVGANSSLVCMAGGGSVENVYVQYDSIGKGVQHYEDENKTVINNHCGTFFSFKEPTATANVSNCVIDISKAEINKNVSIKAVGSEFVSIKNVFVIGGSEKIRKSSNATLSYEAIIDFVEDMNAQGRYKRFSSDFWAVSSGVPISNRIHREIYQEVCKNGVKFIKRPQILIAGTSCKFIIDNDYVKVSANTDSLQIKSGIVTLSQDAVSGDEITFTVTSLFNQEKTDEFDCRVVSPDLSQIVDLTSEGVSYYDVTEKQVYLASLSSKIDGNAEYFVNSDLTAVTYNEDGESAKEIIAVTQNGLYKINCQSVKKVISKPTDLHYIRRDYTVTDYGNKGCYDGVITGNFVMINDIDCSGLPLSDSGTYWENSKGFGGTFDGNGYTISNLSVSKNGLFGTLSFATIKNVKFTGVRLLASDKGVNVGLFANSIYNTLIENVEIEIIEKVNAVIEGTGEVDIYHSSGILCYEKTFDSLFKNVKIDLSKLEKVEFLTEVFYNSDLPYNSQNKSEYENVTVIVASLDTVPAFAYEYLKGENGESSYYSPVEYPSGITVQDKDGNVKE